MDAFVAPALYSHFERSPLVLVDVGASGGVQNTWRRAHRYLRTVAFDPDERAPQGPNGDAGKGVVFLYSGLSGRAATVDFYRTRKQQASSVYRPNRTLVARFPDAERLDVVDKTRIRVDTLDNQLSTIRMGHVDFVKLDTQGSELAILNGATRVLTNQAFGLEIEVEFSHIYEGQPLFGDVDRFVRTFGFELFDLRASRWKRKVGQDLGRGKGQIMFGDALYFRGLESLRRLLTGSRDGPAAADHLLHAIAICILYGFLDYAVELAHEFKGVLAPEEFARIDQTLSRSKSLSRRLPHFPGRGRLARAIYRVWAVLKPYHWSSWEPRWGDD